MKNYVGSAVLASAAFFAAVGDAWADDFAAHLDAPSIQGNIVSRRVAQGPDQARWTINDYVKASDAKSPAALVISTVNDARLIDEAARSL